MALRVAHEVAPPHTLEFMRAELRESCEVKQAISDDLLNRIWLWSQASEKSLKSGHRLFFFGNGGSAADAQHLAAELVATFLRPNRQALPALALTTNASVLTAIANDSDYGEVFSRQVEAFVRPGDVVVGISTSGTSRNVLSGLRTARSKGAVTVGLTGIRCEMMKPLVDVLIDVPSENTQRIQESHITIGHIHCGLLDSCF